MRRSEEPGTQHTMRSSILLTPRNSRKVKGFSQMATDSSVQRLTFYEDLYLKPHKKSASMPNSATMRSRDHSSRTRRQSSMSESQRNSYTKSPVNNPLLDSPPSSRPLTLATSHRLANDNQSGESASAGDGNNNDYLTLSETRNIRTGTRILITQRRKHQEKLYENHSAIDSMKLQKAQSKPTDHVYEVIPAQQFAGQSTKKTRQFTTDESNYIVSRVTSPCGQNSLDRVTNLRSMRRIGRSVDSIKNAQGTKLRSQSTILAPQLWMKDNCKARLGNSASCDNIAGNEIEFGRLPHGFNSLNKENNYPYTCSSTHRDGSKSHNRGLRQVSSAEVSQEYKQSAETTGSTHRPESSANKSLHRKLIPQHRHSASYSGSTSTYENMANVHRNLLDQGHSNYVNIQEYQNKDRDLNYADLDFTLPRQSGPAKPNHRHSRSETPTRLGHGVTSDDDDAVEYTLINITATEAARLASAEHQHYRQRHPPSNKSAT